MSKIFLLREGGTQGLGVPVLTSQRMEGPSGSWILSKITVEVLGRGGGGASSCLSASSFKSIPHVVRELQFLERASATGFNFPAI